MAANLALSNKQFGEGSPLAALHSNLTRSGHTTSAKPGAGVSKDNKMDKGMETYRRNLKVAALGSATSANHSLGSALNSNPTMHENARLNTLHTAGSGGSAAPSRATSPTRTATRTAGSISSSTPHGGVPPVSPPPHKFTGHGASGTNPPSTQYKNGADRVAQVASKHSSANSSPSPSATSHFNTQQFGKHAAPQAPDSYPYSNPGYIGTHRKSNSTKLKEGAGRVGESLAKVGKAVAKAGFGHVKPSHSKATRTKTSHAGNNAKVLRAATGTK